MKETTNKYNLHRYTKCQQLLTMSFQEPVIIASYLRNTHTHTHIHTFNPYTYKKDEQRIVA